MLLLWLVGAIFTPAEEKGGVLALSVADVILRHIRPWVYVTAGFYHPYIVQLVFVLPLAFGLAKRVEPDFGALTSCDCCYSPTRQRQEASFSGFTGGITALLVAYMKPTPFATAPLFPGVPLRFYPLVASVIFCFCTMAGMAFTAVPAVSLMLVSAGPFSVLGGYFGWYYLRFLNKNRDQTVGDVSDEFALVVLLPDFCTPLVGPLANFCFSVVKLCGFYKSAQHRSLKCSRSSRARAMKALDEKLAKLAHARDDTGASSLLSVEVRDDEN
ncbi:hypothetical protein GQ600_19074 [Phytophthora cactorum]|nr:hypothetical protein GQ600_19074 [Phytophthora cactorum]